MTPAQQAALEALAGRPLTPGEIAALESPLGIRNDVELARLLSGYRAPVVRTLLVEEVFEVLYASGDYLSLKAAQLAGSADAVMAFAVLADAKQLGPGRVHLDSPHTLGLFDRLEAAGLLTAAGRAALLARATGPAEPVQVGAVSDALNIAEGRMTL